MKKEVTVAVSGYFDPIHVGHLEYLKLAKWSKCIVDTRNVFSKIKEEFKGKIFNS